MPENKILIINGPNLDKIGQRDSAIYGVEPLSEVNILLEREATKIDLTLIFQQFNHEGDIIESIHNASAKYDGLVINAGGFSHTSVAIHDALEICKIPKIEVHLSNVLNREEFRTNSIISKACNGSVIGMGKVGYLAALFAIKQMLTN